MPKPPNVPPILAKIPAGKLPGKGLLKDVLNRSGVQTKGEAQP
jgi:hypothetical protein